MGKSLFFWGANQFRYGFGKGYRDKRTGSSEECVTEFGENIGSGAESNVLGMAISHVGDLLISVSDIFIAFCMGNMEQSLAPSRLRGMDRFIYVWGLKRSQMSLPTWGIFSIIRDNFPGCNFEF